MDLFLGLRPGQTELKSGLSVKCASVIQLAPPGKLSSNFPTFKCILFQSAELHASGAWTGPTAALRPSSQKKEKKRQKSKESKGRSSVNDQAAFCLARLLHMCRDCEQISGFPVSWMWTEPGIVPT